MIYTPGHVLEPLVIPTYSLFRFKSSVCVKSPSLYLLCVFVCRCTTPLTILYKSNIQVPILLKRFSLPSLFSLDHRPVRSKSRLSRWILIFRDKPPRRTVIFNSCENQRYNHPFRHRQCLYPTPIKFCCRTFFTETKGTLVVKPETCPRGVTDIQVERGTSMRSI